MTEEQKTESNELFLAGQILRTISANGSVDVVYVEAPSAYIGKSLGTCRLLGTQHCRPLCL